MWPVGCVRGLCAGQEELVCALEKQAVYLRAADHLPGPELCARISPEGMPVKRATIYRKEL